MNPIPVVFAQLTNEQQGWLTQKLLGVTLGSAEWVLWLLAILSILSIGRLREPRRAARAR
jgi:biopolymer transport protein ExbB